MTLIAGFKCADGYVICADSQETVGSYRATRQKLVPIAVGKVRMAIAGGGDGDLIDAFVGRFSQKYQQSEIAELDSAVQVFKDDLLAFVKEKKVRIRKIDSTFRFLLGAYSEQDKKCRLWKTVTGDPIEVADYALVGVEDERYEYAARNFYRAVMPISQGVFLGLYLMWLAEQTSNYVKAPISVGVLKDNGLYFEDQNKVNSIDQKVRLFTAQFEAQFLACSDTGLQGEEFGNRLKEFGKTVVQFRRDYIEEWVGHALDIGLNKIVEPWTQIPLGTTIVVASLTPEQQKAQQEQQANLAQSLRENFAHVQEPERIVTNLEALKLSLQKTQAHGLQQGDDPTEDENREAARAHGELLQAALMGPYKVDGKVCALLSSIIDAMPLQIGLGEHQNPALQRANSEMRIALINRVLAYLSVAAGPISEVSGEGKQSSEAEQHDKKNRAE
jgi:20S proteasome alpha/beta subunit